MKSSRLSLAALFVLVWSASGCQTAGTNRDIVLDALRDVPRTTSVASGSPVSDQPSDEHAVDHDTYVIHFRKQLRDLAGRYATIFVREPSILQQVYPGNLIWWDAAEKGSFDPVTTVEDHDLPYLINDAVFATSDGSEFTSFRSDGSKEGYVSKLSGAKIVKHNTKIEHKIASARFLDEALQEMGISGKYLNLTASYSRTSEELTEKSSYFVCFTQSFFSVEVDDSQMLDGGPLSLRKVRGSDKAHLLSEIKKRGEIAYVSSVNYGRFAFLEIAADVDKTELKLAVEAAAKSVKGEVNFKLDEKQQKILDMASTNLVLAGGGGNPATVINGDFATARAELEKYLSANVKLDDPISVVPISMSLRFARDKATAMIAESKHYAYWVPFKRVDVGGKGTEKIEIEIKPPFANTKGDCEFDVGDRGARVKMWYLGELDNEKTGLKVTVKMRVEESNLKFTEPPSSVMEKEVTKTVPQIVQNGRSLEVDSKYLHGEKGRSLFQSADFTRWSADAKGNPIPSPFPSFGPVSNIKVIFDADGDEDCNRAFSSMHVEIPYRVGDVATMLSR